MSCLCQCLDQFSFINAMFWYCQHRNVAFHDKAVQRNLHNYLKLFHTIPTTKHAFNLYKSTTHPHPNPARSNPRPHPRKKRSIKARLLLIYSRFYLFLFDRFRDFLKILSTGNTPPRFLLQIATGATRNCSAFVSGNLIRDKPQRIFITGNFGSGRQYALI